MKDKIMSPESQVMLLRKVEIEPTEEVLENTLEKSVLAAYRELLKIITNDFDLEYEWRFYKDGKAWLLKAIHKKKTIFWLSAWDRSIKTNFYFTEKARSGIFDLPVNGEIKEQFDKAKAVGKLIPLTLEIERKEQLRDFREIVKYKKGLK